MSLFRCDKNYEGEKYIINLNNEILKKNLNNKNLY